jgi:hypothetical protein
MARRGYLQRIAAPLSPGEPVLFAVPGPAAEDARPTAPAAGAPASPAPALRRKPAARPAMAAAGQKSAPDAVIGPPQGEPNFTPAEAHQTPAPFADAPKDWASPPTAAPAARPLPAASAVEPGPKMLPAATPLAATGRAPLTQLALPDPSPVALSPPQAAPAARRPAEPLAAPALAPASPAPAAPGPASVSAAPPWPGPPAEPPRIHIGTIEIRTTTPPPAPAAPPPAPTAAPAAAARAPSASPPRGYAWRFGLIQG